MHPRRGSVALVAALLVISGCSSQTESGPATTTGPAERSETVTDAGDPEEGVEPAPEPEPEPEPEVVPLRAADFDVAPAVRAVRHLAGTIGPREATGPPAGWASG